MVVDFGKVERCVCGLAFVWNVLSKPAAVSAPLRGGLAYSMRGHVTLCPLKLFVTSAISFSTTPPPVKVHLADFLTSGRLFL